MTLREFSETLNLKMPPSSTFRNCYLKMMGAAGAINVDDLKWADIQNMYLSVKKLGIFSMLTTILTRLLENNLYKGDHKEFLYNNLAAIQNLSARNVETFYTTQTLEDGIFYNIPEYGHYSYIHIANISSNPYVGTLFSDFLGSNEAKNVRNYMSKVNTDIFYKGLGEDAINIKTPYDLTGDTFWNLVTAIRQLEDNKHTRILMKTTLWFYRYITHYNPEYPWFQNSNNMSLFFLMSNMALNYLNEGYLAIRYTSEMTLPGDKVCVLFSGLNREITRTGDEHISKLDLTLIENNTYRELFKEFYCTHRSMTYLTSGYLGTYRTLNIISNLKSTPSYPNPNLLNFSNGDGMGIRNMVEMNKGKRSYATLNSYLRYAREFVKWGHDKGIFTVSSNFYSYVAQFNVTKANAIKKATNLPKKKYRKIPDSDLERLDDYFDEHAGDSLDMELCHILFYLAVTTEFRISMLCHLKVDNIQKATSTDYILRSITKVSRGAKQHITITPKTARIILLAIERTESLRNKCLDPTMKDYIFLHEGLCNKISPFDKGRFGKAFTAVCSSLDMNYSAENLRDTYMTKALQHKIEMKKSGKSLQSLTKHKDPQTTIDHYVEFNLEKMLEAMYYATGMEKLDIYTESDSKILSEIPPELNDTAHDVEDNLGKCTQSACDMATIPTCMICKYFRTTPAYETAFIKAIEKLQAEINSKRTMHSKEDIQTIMTLYTCYLKAIYKFKETNHE